MRRSLLPLLTAMVLSACAAGERTGTSSAAATLPGPVTYEVSSWGRLLTHWQVNPDGSGEFWRGSGLGKGEGDVSKYRMTLPPEALRAFAAAVEPIRTRTAKDVKCRDEITDMPYGAITWDYPGARQNYAFNGGCLSPEADAVREQLRAAHDLVEKRAAIEPKPYIVERPSNR
ncbi:hypothetical protein WG901_04795 [Novosphingobium sp. PS1R-30]|uniref:Lipoprotein n=1 Tax=Novosphingobium anseongense TaxID=3133436 RepID=A0ABU8RS79_9SPHN|nr:MAG: hypothetical protein EOO76_04410 [Novosphingobium sp.]